MIEPRTDLFWGHLMPGSLYSIVAIRWMYCALVRYFMCKKEATLGKRNPVKFTSTLTYPWPSSCCLRTEQLPMDAILIIGLSTMHFIFGLLWGVHTSGLARSLTHNTIFFFFIVWSLVMILKHYKFIPVPGADYAVAIVLNLIQGFVMRYHAADRTSLEAQMHMHLAVTFTLCAVSFFLEMMLKHHILAVIVRCVTLSMMGVWMAIISLVLFPPYTLSWDEESMQTKTIMMLVYLWSVAGHIFLSIVIGFIAVLRVRNMTPKDISMQLNSDYERLCTSEKDDFQRRCLINSDDEEV